MLKFSSILKLFFIIILLLGPFESMGVIPVNEVNDKTFKKSKKRSIKDLEKKLGRKLKLKERISFWILKKKFQKTKSSERILPNIALGFSLAAILPQIGLAFGLIGIVFGIISLFLVKNSKYKNWYLRRALFAIIAGVLIIAIHLAVIVAIAIGRSQ